MIKNLKIEIKIDDSNPENCDVDCCFLDDLYDECKLFEEKLCGKINPEIWFRCKQCIDQEIKDET